MAHEIGVNDEVRSTNSSEWHGLGIKIREGLTPSGALAESDKLNWGIAERPISFVNPQTLETTYVDSHKLLLRDDNFECLGVVGAKYVPSPNKILAEFCDALSTVNKRVVVDTLGSVRGGKRVWFCMKSDSFTIRKDDIIKPYLVVATGHDGTMGLRGVPTAIRTVCSNTLHAVVGHSTEESESAGKGSFSFRHSDKLSARLDEAQKWIHNYFSSIDKTSEKMQELADRNISREIAAEFFVRQYLKDFPSPNADNIEAKLKERRQATMDSALMSFFRRWDFEEGIAGSTAWNAFNSYSGLLQHDMKARGIDDTRRIENRVENNLFGLNASRTSRAFVDAFQIAS